MDAPLFTVITPTFNPGPKLAATVASVARQDVAHEHLIVDGGSTDGSLDFVAPPAVRVTSEPDRGVYDAMNKGIRQARGRYLYFLGAGDTLTPGTLGRIARSLPTHDRGFVYGNALMDGYLHAGPISARKLYDVNVSHQAVFYGRDVFGLVGEFDLTYPAYSDWATNIRCFGRPEVERRYVPVVVAEFELGGLSTAGDPAFARDKDAIYRRHLGGAAMATVRWTRVRDRVRMRAGAVRRRWLGW